MAQDVTNLATNIPAPVNYVLMRELLTQARKCLPFFNGTIPGQLEKNGGSMSVKWRRFNDLAVATTALGEITGNASFGMGRDAVNASTTDLTVAVAKYGNAIMYSEELDLFNVNSRAAQLMEVLGRNAGESLNTLMQNVFDASTNVRYSGGVAGETAIITGMSANDIKYVVNQLNRQSAMKFMPDGHGSTNVGSSPIRASYYGICHPDVEEDIRGLSGFVSVEQYGGYTDTEVGEFGAVNGVRWSSTEIGKITADETTAQTSGFRGTTTNDVYSSFIYGKEAVGTVGLGENHAKEIYKMGDRPAAIEVINKPVGSSGVADMYNEVGSVAWKSWFAGKILNQNWIWKVDTLASDLS